MIVYLTVTIGVLLLALFVNTNERRSFCAVMTKQYAYNRIALTGIFLALFLVSALRVNVGNDYGTYVEFMHRIHSGFTSYVPTEPGFNLLTKAVYFFSGFENYHAIFAIFAAATILFFLLGMWRLSENFPFTFTLFMLLGYYFQSISTVRYYLALSMALVAIDQVLRKAWIRFIILVIIGALFHKSLLVILLLYPLARMRWSKIVYFLLGGFAIATLFFQPLLIKVAIFLYPTYQTADFSITGISIINLIRAVFVLLFAVAVFRKELFLCEYASEDKINTTTLRFYYHATILTILLHLFGSFLPAISRISYYLSITQILFVPYLLQRIHGKKRRAGEKKEAINIRRNPCCCSAILCGLYVACGR